SFFELFKLSTICTLREIEYWAKDRKLIDIQEKKIVEINEKFCNQFFLLLENHGIKRDLERSPDLGMRLAQSLGSVHTMKIEYINNDTSNASLEETDPLPEDSVETRVENLCISEIKKKSNFIK
ncbi:hypothetical protein BpHYR1_018665, partial [Brachionus plicatilis]